MQSCNTRTGSRTNARNEQLCFTSFLYSLIVGVPSCHLAWLYSSDTALVWVSLLVLVVGSLRFRLSSK